MLRVALDGIHEVGNEIITALQLNFDIRPCFMHAVAEGDKAVKDGNKPENEDRDDGYNDKEIGRHRSVRSGRSVRGLVQSCYVYWAQK